MSNSARTDNLGYIQSGQMMKPMREQMENKSLLPEYGDMYIGTGNKTELGTPITTTLESPFRQYSGEEINKHNMMIVCDDSQNSQQFGGVGWKDVFDGNLKIVQVNFIGNTAEVKCQTPTSYNSSNRNENKIFPAGEIFINVQSFGSLITAAFQHSMIIRFTTNNGIVFICRPLISNKTISNRDILTGYYIQNTASNEYELYITENITQHYTFTTHYSQQMSECYEIIAIAAGGKYDATLLERYIQNGAAPSTYAPDPIYTGISDILRVLDNDNIKNFNDLLQRTMTSNMTAVYPGFSGQPPIDSSIHCASILKCYRLRYLPALKTYERIDEEGSEVYIYCSNDLWTKDTPEDVLYEDVPTETIRIYNQKTHFLIKNSSGEYSQPVVLANPIKQINRSCVIMGKAIPCLTFEELE